MASLAEMAVGYRESAKLLTDKVSELSSIDKSMMSNMQRFRLKAKINKLESWAREMLSTATMLEHYYDRSGDN